MAEATIIQEDSVSEGRSSERNELSSSGPSLHVNSTETPLNLSPSNIDVATEESFPELPDGTKPTEPSQNQRSGNQQGHDQQNHNVNPEDDYFAGFANLWMPSTPGSRQEIIELLLDGTPQGVAEYSEHIYKICLILYDGNASKVERDQLETKLKSLMNMLPRYIQLELANPAASRLYLIVERCFDVFINIVINLKLVEVASLTVRFMATVMMSLNYWEVYNLLRWKPTIYQFLVLIKFDLAECYARFLRDYSSFKNRENLLSDSDIKLAIDERLAKEKLITRQFRGTDSPECSEDISGYSFDPDVFDEHDRFVLDQLSLGTKSFPRKRPAADNKLAAHKVVKRQDTQQQYARSSNYDPDVVHECHLPSADVHGELCLRRFARKYELIRHQETVHSKRKKLFKCYVCVKQDPNAGPRIFTRHDTLAKHIRVNHRISGKEAKAEVAYSKKHAEIVDESKINIPVGRRRGKGEYEFLIVLDKKDKKYASDEGTIYDEYDGSPGQYEEELDVI